MQGKPVLLDAMDTHYYFEWRSLIACAGTVADAKPQMPCYVSDSEHNVTDLSELIKVSGSYKMKSNTSEYSFNVCRNITGEPSGLLGTAVHTLSAFAIVSFF